MTLTLNATPQPTNDPPRMLLEVAEDDPFTAVQSVVLYRDGVKLRFDPVVTTVSALAYDYDAPFDVPLVYRADADEINTAPEWSEAWASLASWLSPPSGGAAAGWSVAAGVASSTLAGATIYRDTATTITQVDVTAPSNVTLQLADSLNNVLGSVKVTPDGMVTLAGSGAAKTVAGSGDFTLTVSSASLTVEGTGWSTTATFTGTPTRVRLVAPSAASYAAKYGTAGTGVGQFSSPRAIAFDSSGNFFVAEETRKKILKFNSSGVFQSEFGTSGSSAGQFQRPMGLAIDASDNIWVVDSVRTKVIKFNSSGVYQAEYGSAGTGNGQFNQPLDIAFDSSGNFFVVDEGNDRIQKFNSAGTYQSQFGTYGTGNGQFNAPHGIAIDSSNNIYVAEWDGQRVQKFNSAGTYQSKFGSLGTTNGKFNHPGWVAVNSSGSIFVVDQGNHRVQVFDSAGVFVSSFGAFGSGDGQFKYPRAIVVRSSGDVYVVDSSNNRVQKFSQSAGSVEDVVVQGSGLPLQVSATDTETLSPTGDHAGVWVTNANQPDFAILAEASPLSSDDPYFIVPSTRESGGLSSNSVTLAIEGSAEVVTVAVGPRRKETWTLDIACTTQTARNDLIALLADSAAINLRLPATNAFLGLDGGFYAVGDVSVNRIGHPQLGPIAVVSMPLTPSLAPAYKALWQWNARTLAQTGMTSRDVNNAYATARDLVVGPVEV